MLKFSGQLHQLENLRHVLPIDSDMYEFVCEQEVKHKTKEIYSLWASKMHSKALEKMLEIYTLVVENVAECTQFTHSTQFTQCTQSTPFTPTTQFS